MMDGTMIQNLPVVQLQLLDEVTGEPLEYVNPIAAATKVYLQSGGDVDSAIQELVRQLSDALTGLAISSGDFQKHIENRSELNKYDKAGNLVNPDGEGVHAKKDLLDLCIIGREYDKQTGIITYTRYDGTQFEWDSAMEHIPVTMGWLDETHQFYIEDDAGERQFIDFARLVDIYRGFVTDTISVDVVNNFIKADIRGKSIKTKHLADEVMAYLNRSNEFIEKYEDKLEGIEEGANKYVLPVAKKEDYRTEPVEGEDPSIDKRRGGVVIGSNINVTEDGVISAVNIVYGETPESAIPVNLFMKIVSTEGPSTDPLPTVTARKSYITTEGNIILGKDNGLFDYISASTDGTRISDLTDEQVNSKLFKGLEILDLDGITWYNNDSYNYAITSGGDGFIYDRTDYVFIDYITRDDFIALVNSGNYHHGPHQDLPALL